MAIRKRKVVLLDPTQDELTQRLLADVAARFGEHGDHDLLQCAAANVLKGTHRVSCIVCSADLRPILRAEMAGWIGGSHPPRNVELRASSWWVTCLNGHHNVVDLQV